MATTKIIGREKLSRLAMKLILGLSALILAIPEPVSAQSSQCLNLQNQLNVITTGGRRTPSKSRYRQYDRAAREQQAQIKKTQRMASRNGCNRRILKLRNSGTCGRIVSSLQQMKSNLANLQQQKRRFGPRNRAGGDRRTIVRAMQRQGCFNGSGAQRIARNAPRRRSLVEQIFGLRTFRNDGRRSNGQFPPDLHLSSRSGTYRTLCVRKSDGYYFPISFSTLPNRFPDDEEACQAKCPGGDVDLYYHAIPSQDSEDMISFRTQEAYIDLDSAFSYRKKFDPASKCSVKASNIEEIAGSSDELIGEPDTEETVRIGKPIFQKDRTLDPESLASLEGNFDELEVAQYMLLANGGDSDKNNTGPIANIRIVGPAFFPVQ